MTLDAEAPLRFYVRAVDGALLDSFAEDELVTYRHGHVGKTWHEAACWTAVAVAADRKRRPEVYA